MGNPIKHSDIIQQGNPAKDAIKSIELLEKTAQDVAKGIEKSANTILESLKKINVATNKGKEATVKASEKTKKLTEAQKNNARIAKELVKTKERLRTVQGIQNKGLVKNRAELQKANQEIKRNSLLTKAQKGSYDQLNLSLNKNVARWKAMSEAERRGTKEGRRLTQTIKQQDAALKKLDARIGRSQRNVGNYAGAFRNLGSAMGLTLGGAGIFMVLRNATKIIAGFEKEMAKVRAISGATGKEFDQLKKQAEDLGASTLFTAQQVASLEVAYSKLGFSTQEILNATAATLDLAVATDSELSAAAEVAGATLRGFGLDAAKMTRVVDIMAKGFTTSALDIENFRESMKLIAPIAKAANISLEITTNILGKLADAGLKGSIGATGLKNVLFELTSENSELSKHLGFTVKNAEDLQKAFDILRGEALTLADAEGLIDKRGRAALLILANNKDMANLLKDAYIGVDGAARDMAAIMETTLTAKVTLLNSAWQGFILSLDKANSRMGFFVKNSIDEVTGLIEFFTKKKEFFFTWSDGPTFRYVENEKEKTAVTVEEANKRIELLQNEAISIENQIKLEGERLKDLYGDDFTNFNDILDQKDGAKLKFLFKQAANTDKEIEQLKEVTLAAEIEAAIKAAAEQDAIDDANKKKIKAQGAANKKLLGLTELREEEEQEIIGDGFDWEFKANKKKNKKIEEDEKELTKKLGVENDARIKSNLQRLESDEKARKKAIEDQKRSLEELSMIIRNQMMSSENAISTTILGVADLLTSFNQIALTEFKDSFSKTLAEVQIVLSTISLVGTALFNQRIKQLDEESIALQESKAFELSLVEGNAEKEAQTRAKFNAKEKQLKTEQAKTNRNAALFESIINTAIGVTAALGSAPPPLNFILAGLVGAAGAVQQIAIATTPLPKFEKGGSGMVNKGHGVLKGDRHSAKSGGIPVGVAEDKEYFGVINRTMTNKYSDELPSVFNSLNNGNFEHIWKRTNDNINVNVNEKYGRKMFDEMRNKETNVNGKRIITRGKKTLILR